MVCFVKTFVLCNKPWGADYVICLYFQFIRRNVIFDLGVLLILTLWVRNRLSCSKKKENKNKNLLLLLKVPSYTCRIGLLVITRGLFLIENLWRDSLVSDNLVCSDRETKPLVSYVRVVKRLALETSSWLPSVRKWTSS